MTHAPAKAGLATVLMLGALWAGTAANAAIASFGGNGNGNGNGSHNKNSFLINSPNFNNDVQHVRNANIDGVTISPAALCKWPARHCKIVQKIFLGDP